MPYAPKRHRAIRSARRQHRSYDKRRGSARQRGYDTAWDKFSAWYRKEHPLCEECVKNDLIIPVDVVDHIIPLAEGGAHCDEENAMSLCWSCHEKKKAREKRAR